MSGIATETVAPIKPAVEVQPVGTPRLQELDGLRGIAILLVLVWHYLVLQIPGIPRGVMLFGGLTWSGVDLFFVLSGFLIGGILLDARSSPQYFKTFYIRRFYRIVPIYAVVCLLFVVAVALQIASRFPSLSWLFSTPPPLPWYSYATFTQNIAMSALNTLGPNWLAMTWSLGVEEQFYLTLPLIIRYVKPTRLPYVLGFFIIAAPLLRFLCVHLGYPAGAILLMPCRADSLLLGVLGAVLVRHPSGRNLVKEHRKLLYAIAVLLTAAGVISHANSPSNPLLFSWLGLLYFLVLVLAVCDVDGMMNRLLRARPLIATGIVAYGLYMFHQPISGLCYGLIRGKSPHMSNWLDLSVMSLAAGLTFILAKLSWKYFERPLVKKSHHYVY